MNAIRALAVCVLIALGACVSGDRSPGRGVAGSSVVREGLASEVWIVRDPGGDRVAQTLAPFDEDAASAGVMERWRRSGLRVVRVPLTELEAVRRSLTAGGQVNVRALGETPAWIELFEGPLLREAGVRLDSGFVRLDAGHPRLLVRAWSEPGVRENAIVAQTRIELVPQHHPSAPSTDGLRLGPAREIPPVEDGQVFDRLLLSVLTETGVAYLIVGEAPEFDWRAQVEPSDTGSTEGAEADDARESVDPPGKVAFPRSRASMRPTLGEAMLNAASYTGGSRDERAILVLIPPASSSYSLLGG